jgi:hypothetical protein
MNINTIQPKEEMLIIEQLFTSSTFSFVNSSEFGGGGDVIALRTTRCSIRCEVLRDIGNHAATGCHRKRATTRASSFATTRAILSAQKIVYL